MDCPNCGYTFEKCMIDSCGKPAEFEAWFRRGDPASGGVAVMARLKVCRDCVKQSEAYKKHGEAAFDKQ